MNSDSIICTEPNTTKTNTGFIQNDEAQVDSELLESAEAKARRMQGIMLTIMPRYGTTLKAPVMTPKKRLFGMPIRNRPIVVKKPLQDATTICPRK